MKHLDRIGRLSTMRSTTRTVAFGLARTLGLVVLATILILVILPAVLAAQAATAV